MSQEAHLWPENFLKIAAMDGISINLTTRRECLMRIYETFQVHGLTALQSLFVPMLTNQYWDIMSLDVAEPVTILGRRTYAMGLRCLSTIFPSILAMFHCLEREEQDYKRKLRSAARRLEGVQRRIYIDSQICTQLRLNFLIYHVLRRLKKVRNPGLISGKMESYHKPSRTSHGVTLLPPAQ